MITPYPIHSILVHGKNEVKILTFNRDKFKYLWEYWLDILSDATSDLNQSDHLFKVGINI